MKERRKAFRVRIHNVDELRIYLYLDGFEFMGKMYDYSRFGVGVLLPKKVAKDFSKNQEFDNCTIFAYGKKKDLGRVRLIRMFEKNEDVLFGLNLFSEFVDINFLLEHQSLSLQEDESRKINMHFGIFDRIQPEFKDFVVKFSYGLSMYKISLDELDEKFSAEPKSLRESLFQATLQGIGKDFYNFLTSSINDLGDIVKDYSKFEHEISGFFLRKSIFHFIQETEFIKRTNLRPRGYAGDAEMMELIYKNEYLGDSTFGKIFHKHAIETKAADAVRNRRKLIVEAIEGISEKSSKPLLKVFCVACGPAWEVRDFFKNSRFSEKVEFFLLDQDEEALMEAEKNISLIEKGKYLSQCHFLQDSVRTILKTKDPNINFGEFDFIYSMGLYDYLAGSVAKALTTKLFAMLDTEGVLMIGNYHESNPTRRYMEYIMDWVLYYRDEEGILEFLEDTPRQKNVQVSFENSGTQMFLIAS